MENIKKNQSISGFVSPKQLPGILSEIAELMGVETALIISDEFGGSGVYLAKWVDGNNKQGRTVSALIECIGGSNARQLCQLWGGTHITIPSCKNLIRKMRDQAICADVKRGVKRATLVRKYGISDRRIRSIISTAAQRLSAGS